VAALIAPFAAVAPAHAAVTPVAKVNFQPAGSAVPAGYTADTSPGDTTGNGVNLYGALWYAVQPNGSNAPVGGSSGSGSTTSGSPY